MKPSREKGREARIERAKALAEFYEREPNTMESLESAIECVTRLVQNHAALFYETEDTGYIWLARWRRIQRHIHRIARVVPEEVVNA